MRKMKKKLKRSIGNIKKTSEKMMQLIIINEI